jgi:hypothetical protein
MGAKLKEFLLRKGLFAPNWYFNIIILYIGLYYFIYFDIVYMVTIDSGKWTTLFKKYVRMRGVDKQIYNMYISFWIGRVYDILDVL